MDSLALSIVLISLLNRTDELIVPSWPWESITTFMASAIPVVVSKMPAIKVLVGAGGGGFGGGNLLSVAMRMVADSPATPALRRSMLLSHMVSLTPVPVPTA